ncbi:MAG: sulfite exporter TauE/SafE family protein [Desulfobacterales bacterium]
MEFTGTTTAVLAVFFIAMLIKSIFGFGDALLAMPLLTLAVGIRTATPLFALVGTTITLVILSLRWRHVVLKSAWRLILSSIFGIPLGLYFLKGSFETAVNLVLALVIILFSAFNLTRPNLPRLNSERYAVVFGFISGILGGAYNTSGPPVIIYSALRRWRPESILATLQGYFFPLGIFILIGHALTGLWTSTVVEYYVICLPVSLAALAVGSRLNRAIPQGRFEKYIFVLLLFIGFFLLMQTLLTQTASAQSFSDAIVRNHCSRFFAFSA